MSCKIVVTESQNAGDGWIVNQDGTCVTADGTIELSIVLPGPVRYVTFNDISLGSVPDQYANKLMSGPSDQAVAELAAVVDKYNTAVSIVDSIAQSPRQYDDDESEYHYMAYWKNGFSLYVDYGDDGIWHLSMGFRGDEEIGRTTILPLNASAREIAKAAIALSSSKELP